MRALGPSDRTLARVESGAFWATCLDAMRRAPNGLAALTAVAHHAMSISKRPPAAVRRVFHKLGTEGELAHMTAAHILTKQARPEGRSEGRAEGRAELVLEMLAAKFGAMSPTAESAVRAASERELDAMAIRLLSASSLDEVLEAGKTK